MGKRHENEGGKLVNEQKEKIIASNFTTIYVYRMINQLMKHETNL